VTRCAFCKGTGQRYRPYSGRTDCLACEGTGQQPLPPVESWREQRLRLRREADAREEAEQVLETTRAAPEDGPKREHGSREEEPTGQASLPAPTSTTPTRKEQ
jgi:hypothetical protein